LTEPPTAPESDDCGRTDRIVAFGQRLLQNKQLAGPNKNPKKKLTMTDFGAGNRVNG